MKYPYADMHCDTLLHCISREGGLASLYDLSGMQSIRQMTEAGQLLQFFAVFFPPVGEEPELPPDEEFFRILREHLYRETALHADVIAMARNYEEIMENQKQGKASAVLTVEDGRMVEGSHSQLQMLYDQGVRAIALTWNFPNCFGYPNSPDPNIMKRGLTDFGKEAVEEMNRMGVLADVSHLSDGGFYDVAALSRKPFIASHSNCRALTPHPRNLTDDMIRILAEKGGVAGLNFCPAFVGKTTDCQKTTVEDLGRHVLHFIQVGGEDCVGLGTDFDGMDGELEIGHPSEMYRLFDYLEKQGLTQRQLDKIANGNVLRVIRDSMR